MLNPSQKRLLLSTIIAFLSYAIWSYYANSLVTSDFELLFKASLVQGSYSAISTFLFTYLLENFSRKIGAKKYCLMFLTPHIENTNNQNNPSYQIMKLNLLNAKAFFKGKCIPGTLITPLPPLFIQSTLVISVNYLFATPNLWLTVAPSILFSAIYGYSYSVYLGKKISE